MSDDAEACSVGSADHELFRRLRRAPQGSPHRRRLRNHAIHTHLPLVHRCVNDVGPRREVHEDVVQVGTIGLIHAVDRFDPERGVGFHAYARPTIHGEILRYFRDRDPAIRLPRRHHEISRAVRSSREHMRHRLGHEPSLADLAQFLGIAVAEVEGALAAETACTVRSLDALTIDPDDGQRRARQPGRLDADLEAVTDHEALRQCLARLQSEERQIISLLFWSELTQDQVAARLGRSQMYVSRTLRRATGHLRQMLNS